MDMVSLGLGSELGLRPRHTVQLTRRKTPDCLATESIVSCGKLSERTRVSRKRVNRTIQKLEHVLFRADFHGRVGTMNQSERSTDGSVISRAFGDIRNG